MVTHCKNVYNFLHWEAIPSSIYKCVESFKSKINSGPSIQSPIVDFHSFYFIHYKNNGFQKYICVELSFNVESMATAKKKKKTHQFHTSSLSPCPQTFYWPFNYVACL